MYKTILLFSLCFLTSCIKDKADTSYKMCIDVVMKQDDSIQVFYTSDGSINFNETQSFWTKVKGSSKNKEVMLTFPDTVVPNQVRIDFGRNKNQDDIVLNKIQFSYKGNSFEAKGKEIYNYFWADTSYTVLDRDFGLLKRKVKGQLNGPSLYPSGYYLAVKLDELKYKSKK